MLAARRVAGMASAGFIQLGSTAPAVRNMSDGIKAFKDRETAQESHFFTQEDQRLMAKLLAKVKEQSKVTDKAASQSAASAELAAAKEILSKYKVSDADLNKLVQWKHTTY